MPNRTVPMDALEGGYLFRGKWYDKGAEVPDDFPAEMLRSRAEIEAAAKGARAVGPTKEPAAAGEGVSAETGMPTAASNTSKRQKKAKGEAREAAATAKPRRSRKGSA